MEVKITHKSHEATGGNEQWTDSKDDKCQFPAVNESNDNATDKCADPLEEVTDLVTDTILHFVDVTACHITRSRL